MHRVIEAPVIPVVTAHVLVMVCDIIRVLVRTAYLIILVLLSISQFSFSTQFEILPTFFHILLKLYNTSVEIFSVQSLKWLHYVNLEIWYRAEIVGP